MFMCTPFRMLTSFPIKGIVRWFEFLWLPGFLFAGGLLGCGLNRMKRQKALPLAD